MPARHEQTILAGRRIRNPSFTLKIARESRDGGIAKPAALTRKALHGAYTAIERRPLRIDLTHSTRRCRMTGICAKETAGVDVKRTSQIAALDASIGRIAGLQGLPREGPESAR